MSGYAAGTKVAIDRTRAEIDRTLVRFGASAVAHGWDSTTAVLGFRAGGIQVRIALPLPQPDDVDFTETATGRPRTVAAARDAYSNEVQRRWRSLALVLKAKLEAVATGIATMEQEFLAYRVLPDGTTVGERVAAELDRVGDLTPPALLPGLDGALR